MSEQAVRKTQSGIEQRLIGAARSRFVDDEDAQNVFVKNTKQRLSYSWNISEAVRNADLVIEAITENLEAKQALFADIEWVSDYNSFKQ